MQRLDHRIREARIAVDDPDGFWLKGSDLLDREIARLNTRVALGEARIIRPDGYGAYLVTFGNGFHYFVEVVVHCPECGSRILIEETAEDTLTCHTCRPAALDALAAGF